MRRLITTGLLLAAATLFTAEADAAARCGDRNTVVAYLEETWGETQRAFGIAGGRQLVELFASESGSWTILLTSARGSTCLMAAGRGFQAVEPATLEGDPA